uniref:Synapsin ATP-binding domain-containing protein n=1 Tax=Trichuris muris TaxID=70415 RepID=A0A5S6R2J3_TRIMR
MQSQTPMNFTALKDSFNQGVTFLKRRFSSADLTDEQAAEAIPSPRVQSSMGQRQDFRTSQEQLTTGRASFATSAPTSPARQSGASSIMQGITKTIFQAAVPKQSSIAKEHSKCILIIDNQCVDWSKYFRGRKILGDWNVRIEQTEFSKISMIAQSDPTGCVVTTGGHSFRPDFVLIRQPVKERSADWRPVVMGFLYAAVPSLNTLHSVYNFADKPWVFAHLLMLQRRMGTDRFPLIEQLYCYQQPDLCNSILRLPSVIKVGQAYGGIGKMKVSLAEELEDLSSFMAVCQDYYTSEPFVDAKYDMLIQKIGPNCKAFMRKGIGQSWKTNTGASVLEQVALTDKHKEWIAEASKLFGGLDMCSIAALVGKDGREYIYKMNDCTFTLIGDTQEEDRRQIADLVIQKINHIFGIRQAQQRKGSTGAAASSPHNFIKHESPKLPPRGESIGNSEVQRPQPQPASQVQPVVQPPAPSVQHGPPPPVPARPPTGPIRQMSFQNRVPREESTTTDDTMSNLKKTFAGIFGDM